LWVRCATSKSICGGECGGENIPHPLSHWFIYTIEIYMAERQGWDDKLPFYLNNAYIMGFTHANVWGKRVG
jgi:hypothetical protein